MLRGICVAVADPPRVVGQALREIPLSSVYTLNPDAREHGRETLDRRQRTSAVPAVRIAGRGDPLTQVRLGGDQAHRRGLDVERVPVLAQVGDANRGYDV